MTDALLVQLIHESAFVPERAYTDDAGYDLRSTKDVVVHAGTCATIPTGIAIRVPCGTYGRIAPRSSLGVKNVIVNAGVVDRSFSGEICVVISSLSQDLHIKRGDKIAQLILEKCATPNVLVVDTLPTTDRGARGFGSSGR